MRLNFLGLSLLVVVHATLPSDLVTHVAGPARTRPRPCALYLFGLRVPPKCEVVSSKEAVGFWEELQGHVDRAFTTARYDMTLLVDIVEQGYETLGQATPDSALPIETPWCSIELSGDGQAITASSPILPSILSWKLLNISGASVHVPTSVAFEPGNVTISLPPPMSEATPLAILLGITSVGVLFLAVFICFPFPLLKTISCLTSLLTSVGVAYTLKYNLGLQNKLAARWAVQPALPLLARFMYLGAAVSMFVLLFTRHVAAKLAQIQAQLAALKLSGEALTADTNLKIDTLAIETNRKLDLVSATNISEIKQGAVTTLAFEQETTVEVASIQAKLDELKKLAARSPPQMAPIAPPKIDPRVLPDVDPDDVPSWVKEVYPDRLYIRPESALIELVYAQAGESALTVIKQGTVVDVSGPPVHTAPGGFGGKLPLGETLVQPFVILGQSTTDATKRKRLALRAIFVTKTDAGLQWRFHDEAPRALKPGEQYPNYADLQLHHCRTEFAFQGKPKATAPVTCTLTFKSGYVPGDKVVYKSQLNAKGQLNVILAPDFVTLCEVQGEDGIKHSEPPVKPPIKRFEEISAPEPTVIDPKALSALPNYTKDKAVFMCDVSGSMRQHTSKLHTGLRETIERYCSAGKDFVIVTWGNRFEFPHGERWQKPLEKQALLGWVNTVECNQGTSMRQAFEGVANSTMKHEIRHIIMMCDGDVNIDVPFLAELKTRIPNLQHVGFAAFGDAARDGNSQGENMMKLAKSTGGGFYKLGT